MNIGKELVNTTSDHPFFVGGRWLWVKDLHVGDSVSTYRGTKVVISRIEMVAKRTVVHNFEVEDYHTYYVSGQEFLVHNNGCNVATRTEGGVTTGKSISDKKALEMVRKGKDVITKTRSKAIEIAKKAFKGKPMRHEGHLLQNGEFGLPHVHPNQHINGSHIFYP